MRSWLQAATRRLPAAIAAVALLCGAVLAHADAQVSATASAPTPYPKRVEDWPGRGVVRIFGWMEENRRHFWRERERKQGSVVFVGDSLTASWPQLASDFPALTVANRGIGGDVSRGLLFRFDEDVLDLHPKAIVLLIGTNDLTARQRAADTIANLETILDMRDRKQPSAKVLLCTVPPSASPKAPVDAEQLKVLNAGIRRLAATRKDVALVDLYAAFAEPDGAPNPRWFKPDRLHLSAEGYARWKTVLEPVFREQGLL